MQKYLRLCTEKAAEAIHHGISTMVGIRRRVFGPEFLLVGLLEQDDSVVLRILEELSRDPLETRGRIVDACLELPDGTSNVGSQRIAHDRKAIGFGRGEDRIEYEEAHRLVMDDVRKTFKPEFINRIDEIIVFHQLEKAHLRQIVDLVLGRLAVQLEERSITIEVTPEVRDFLVEVGFSPVYGARPLNREVERRIENPLSLAIIDGRFGDGDTVIVELGADHEMEFRKAPAKRKRRKAPRAASASASAGSG